MNYYQPYLFSKNIEKDSYLLKEGMVLNVQDIRKTFLRIFSSVFITRL